MLQHLVRVHDVERRVGEVERVHVTGLERRVRDLARVGRARGVDDVGFVVEPDDATGSDAGGEVDRDRPGTAPDVEHVDPGAQPVDQVGGGVLDRAAAV